jgi:hypothetical protein
MEQNSHLIAWAAGIFEGEGSVSFHADKGHWPTLQMVSTDPDVLHRFRAVVGHGNVRGPYSPPSQNWARKPQWRWQCGGADAQAVSQMLLPWLCQRRVQQLNKVFQWRRKFPIPQCGTEAGYKRHKRQHESICDPCRRAMNTANRQRRARRLQVIDGAA